MGLLIENIGKKIQRELGNYETLEFSEKIRIPTDTKNPSQTPENYFKAIKDSPVPRQIVFSNSFIKSLYKLPDKLISLVPIAQFFLLVASRGKESTLPSTYRFHSIPAEVKDHYVVHIGWDYAIRFSIEKDKIVLKDFLSHAERGY